jgi:hypothetical protein
MVAAMALARGSRLITVGDQRYRWLVSSRDEPSWLRLVVQHAGGTGARLCADIGRHRIILGPIRQRVAVAPGFVRWTIELALAEGWQPEQPGPDHRLSFSDAYVRRLDWAREWPRLLRWDPLTELAMALDERGGVSDAWVARWGASGDPLHAAWAVSRDPGVMLDVLAAAGTLAAVEQAFAAPDPRVSAVAVELPADIDALIEAARRGDLRSTMISFTDVGPSAPYATFCDRVSALVRALCPAPPTLATYLAGRRPA